MRNPTPPSMDIRVLKGTNDFGEVNYTLSNRDAKAAESVGIPGNFTEEHLEVMQARCLAQGYNLVIMEKGSVQSLPQPEPPTKEII